MKKLIKKLWEKVNYERKQHSNKFVEVTAFASPSGYHRFVRWENIKAEFQPALRDCSESIAKTGVSVKQATESLTCFRQALKLEEKTQKND